MEVMSSVRMYFEGKASILLNLLVLAVKESKKSRMPSGFPL